MGTFHPHKPVVAVIGGGISGLSAVILPHCHGGYCNSSGPICGVCGVNFGYLQSRLSGGTNQVMMRQYLTNFH